MSHLRRGFSWLIGGLVERQENCHWGHPHLLIPWWRHSDPANGFLLPVQGAAGHAVPNITNASARRGVPQSPEDEAPQYIGPLVSIVLGRSFVSPFLSSGEHAPPTFLNDNISSSNKVEESFTHESRSQWCTKQTMSISFVPSPPLVSPFPSTSTFSYD